MNFLRNSNLRLSKDFINKSANGCSVFTCSNDTIFDSTKFLMKWCLISIWLVLECCKGFLEILIPLSIYGLLWDAKNDIKDRWTNKHIFVTKIGIYGLLW